MKSLSLLFLFLISHSLYAQTGSWQPQNADTTYPRTILKKKDISTVRNTLVQSPWKEIYNGIFGTAFSSLPSGNSSTADRHARAIIAKNAAFVLLMDKQPSGISLSTTQKDTLGKRAIKLIETANTKVEQITITNTTAYDNWQWHSKSIIHLCIAYDLLKGAGYSDTILHNARANLQLFAGNLYKEATRSIFGFTFFSTIKNNHSLMTAAALGMAAVVLNKEGSSDVNFQPVSWINAAMWNIDNVLWVDAQRQSEPGIEAGYAEGPYYFKYAFDNCLPFFRAIGHFLPDTSIGFTFGSSTRGIRNPYYDTRYDLLYKWTGDIRMPDGRLPAIDDSYIDFGMPELALTGKQQLVWPMAFSKFSVGQSNSLSSQLFYATDLRADYIASHLKDTTTSDSLLISNYTSGDLVFRSSWDSDALYMHVQAEHGRARTSGGGHNQADEGSFLIEAYGQLLAMDPGYISYTRRNEVGNASNHNMILVDSAGPAIGSPGSANGADVFIDDAFYTPNLSIGKISTSYSSTNIDRTFFLVRNKYFLNGDIIKSSQSHTYTWQLHGYGLENGNAATGVFRDYLSNNSATWEKNGVKLQVAINAEDSNIILAKKTNEHELSYNKTENHTTLLASKANVFNTSFASVLYPSVSDSIGAKIVNNSGTAGIRIPDKSYSDFFFTSTVNSYKSFIPSQSGLTKSLSADGEIVFFSNDNAGKIAQYYIQNGSSLKYGLDTLLALNKPGSFLYNQVNPDSISGYVRGTDIARVFMFKPPHSIQGKMLKKWEYDKASSILTMHFSGASDYEIKNGIYSNAEITYIDDKIESLIINPNPFKNTTSINYLTNAEENIHVEIYDLQGRKVNKFFKSEFKPGYYTFTLNRADLPVSGVYILKLTGKNTIIVKKVILE